MARTAPRPARGWDTKTFRRHNPSNYPLAFAHFRTLFRRYGACEVLFYALARSYPGLLTKSDPPKRPFGALSGWQGQLRDRLVGGIQRPCAPSARMKSPLSLLAHGQGLFFAWVTLSEHKWVTSRERRGLCGLASLVASRAL